MPATVDIIVPILKIAIAGNVRATEASGFFFILGKVFMKIMQAKQQKHSEHTRLKEQTGFRPYLGCSDQIFTLCQLAEERIRCGK